MEKETEIKIELPNRLMPEFEIIQIAKARGMTQRIKDDFNFTVKELASYGVVAFNRAYIEQLTRNEALTSKIIRLCNDAVNMGVLGEFIRNGRKVYRVA